jgi:hypothetical protein
VKATVFPDPADLIVTEDEVARQAGGYGYRPDEDNRRLIAALTAQAGKLIAPAFCYTVEDGAAVPGWLSLLATVTSPGLSGEALPEPCRVAFVVCTIGERIDREILAMAARQTDLDALLLHGAALALLETVARRAWHHLADSVGTHGLFAGARLEPGCRQLPLTRQIDVFERVDAAEIGVTLNDSLLMTPLRSLSFVVPINATRPALTGDNKCLTCTLASCQFRTPLTDRESGGNG